MDVKTALEAFEAASEALAAADTNLETAKTKEADALAKLQAAKSATLSADDVDLIAADSYNKSVDDLVSALTATKRV